MLETDHSLSVFPQVDVTTCVLPLSEHKRGRRPPHCPSLSPLPSPLSKSEPPAPRALRTGPALIGPPRRERAPLVWTNAGALAWNEAKVQGILARAGRWYFLITHRKLLLQRTLSESIYREDWGSYGVSPLCPLLPGVWAGGVSTNKLEGMPPKDSLHCLYIPRWHLICNGDAVLMCALTS